MTIGSPYI